MAEENTTSEQVLQQFQVKGASLGIKDILALCVSKWYWFVICVVVALAVATVHLLHTPPVYVRSASLLVKDNSSSGSGDMASTFSDMGLEVPKTNINNVLLSLQAPSVVYEVVRRLGLDVDYKVKGTFRDETLYGSSLPVKATFAPGWPDDALLSFTLHLQPGGKVELTDLSSNRDVALPERLEGRLGEPISTPLGKVVLSSTSHYSALRSYPDIVVSRIGLFSAADRFKAGFSAVLQSENATIIDLSYNDVSVERAEDVLNTLIDVYNEDWVKDHNKVMVSTSQFINERLGMIERELGDVDNSISSFKSANLLPDVEGASQMYMSQSQSNTNQLSSLDIQLSMARYVRDYVTAHSGRNQLLPTNSGINNQGIEQQISEYNTIQLQRNNLLANSSDDNPLIGDYDKQLAQLRRALLSSIDNLIASLNTQIAGLQRDEARTNAQLAANPRQSKYLLAVGRQQKVKEQLYLYLLQKREENELSQAFTAYNTRLLSPPTGNFVPVAPKGNKILLIAFVLGLVVPLGAIWIRASLNSTVRGRKDVEGLSVPFLGEIPLCLGKAARPSFLDGLLRRLGKERKRDRLTVVVKDGKRDVVNEAFRIVRTNIEFMTRKDPSANVLLLTSFNPGSGKSFLSMNIAVSLALKHKRVLVIDGDLRRASASTYVGSPHEGLSDYLSGGVADVHDLLVSYGDYDCLHVLPVGTLPPNPTELLYDERFRSLVAALRREYDYVFIDCPPVNMMADTQIIEQYVDRTVFVVRAGLFERSMLPELERVYQQKTYKNMSMILNGTENGGHRYGYKYGYGYGYGYGSQKN